MNINKQIKQWAMLCENEDSAYIGESNNKKAMPFNEISQKIISEIDKNPSVADLPIFAVLDGSDRDLYLTKDSSTHTIKSYHTDRNSVYINTFTTDESKALTLNTVTFDGTMYDRGERKHVTYTFLDNIRKSSEDTSDLYFEIPMGSHYGDSHQIVSDKVYATVYDIKFGRKGIYFLCHDRMNDDADVVKQLDEESNDVVLDEKKKNRKRRMYGPYVYDMHKDDGEEGGGEEGGGDIGGGGDVGGMMEEASASEGEAYRKGMVKMGEDMASEILRVWSEHENRTFGDGEAENVLKQKGNSYPYIEVICALAEYVKNMPNAESIDREMATKFSQIGAAYMI